VTSLKGLRLATGEGERAINDSFRLKMDDFLRKSF